MTGSLTTTGKISVLGNNSVGVRTGAVSGNVIIGNASSTIVQGQNAVGVSLGGDIGGAFVIQGTVLSSGYRSTTPPADTSKLDSDDLLQGGSAVVVGGSVAGGILLDARPADNSTTDTDEDDDGIPDANETTASVTSAGAAPAIAIGSTTQDINIGQVGHERRAGDHQQGLNPGHWNLRRGQCDRRVDRRNRPCGKCHRRPDQHWHHCREVARHQCDRDPHRRRRQRAADRRSAGTISANGAGTDGSAAQAIVIDTGATVNAITNSGTIVATRLGDKGTAAAIVDHSGTLALVQNNGQIGISNAADIGDNATAIDLRAISSARPCGRSRASGTVAPLIAGNILFGAGNDTLDIQAGKVFGKVDFGGGADVLSL